MSAETLDITILGSGTSTGVPVIGCRCAVCRSENPRNNRTRSSILLHSQEHNILIDTATDLRQQALRHGLRTLDAVLYTHAHADHINGIDDLRSFNLPHRQVIPVYGAAQTLQHIGHLFDYIFNPSKQSGFVPLLKLCPVESPFRLFDLEITPIPLIHGDLTVYGYRCGPLAYLTDCSAIPARSFPLLKGLDLLILDGLRFKSHPTHFNIQQAIEAAQQVRARRTLLTHLTHDVEHVRDSRNLPADVEFAYDGQQITLNLSTSSIGRNEAKTTTQGVGT